MDRILGVLEFGGFTASTYMFFFYIRKQKHIMGILQYMERARVLSPDLLETAMNQFSKLKEFQKDIQNYTHEKEYAQGIAFIQGIVSSNNPLYSAINGKAELIFSQISSEPIYSNNKRRPESQRIICQKAINEFSLKSGAGSNNQIFVGTSKKVDYSKAISFVDSSVNVRELSTIEKLISWILFCINMIISLSSMSRRVTGFRVGHKKIERGVLLGQMIVAFGNVFYDKMNKEMRMEDPQFFLKDKYQLIAEVKNKGMRLSRNIAIMASIMTICGFLVARRIKIQVVNFLAQRKKSFERQLKDKLFQIRSILTTDFKCVNCKDTPRNVILKPCMHMVYCKDCYQDLQVKASETTKLKCPSCKCKIQDEVKLYLVS